MTKETAKDRPRVKGMTFKTEIGAEITDPVWVFVKSALACLDTGKGNSFAILSVGHNSFVQAPGPWMSHPVW